MNDGIAAENLTGLTLDSGWEVLEKIKKGPGATGGFFSVCYKVRKDGQISFLKAFNFASFLAMSKSMGLNKPIVDIMKEMSSAFIYERDLSKICRDHHVSKVVFVKGAGEQFVSGFSVTYVPYLIFDMADSDVRAKLTFTENLDAAWKLKSLHSIAVGLRQLHNLDVSHQDLKPSNVLLFNGESKLGDLGRSTTLRIDSYWRIRSFAADSYLFGSMVTFYFIGVTMNALIRKHIPDNLSWEKFRGAFGDVAPYILDAFRKSLDELEGCITEPVLKADIRGMVEYLCFPLPEKRGHPKIIGGIGDQYNLERVISRLDYLHKKLIYQLKQQPV
ncbi:MAG: protein kinase [Bacteroidetes bacterium]|nr:protein kinase [Bacteroidota bacterium]